MALHGLIGILINVEVDVSAGMPVWNVVGLPDAGIRESKDRIKTAIKNCGIDLESRKYIINLSPADIKKEGTGFDLAIAVGILNSIGIIQDFDAEKILFIGELSLNGKINRINGVLPICLEALKYGIKKIILPKDNIKEAGLVRNIESIGVEKLNDVIKYLNREINILPEKNNQFEVNDQLDSTIDFSEVKGHKNIKRAIEIAAAGRT